MRRVLASMLAAALAAACAGPLEDRCTVDADCRSGKCRAVEGVRLCVAGAYTLSIGGPDLVGRTARVPVSVRRDPGAPLPQLSAHVRLDGVELPDPQVEPGSDGAVVVLELPEGGDAVPLRLQVEIAGTGTSAARDLTADLAAPRLSFDPPEKARRGEPIVLEVRVEESHAPDLLAAVTAGGGAAPAAGDPAWTGVPIGGGVARASLDGSTAALPALDGSLTVHLRASDATGNVRDVAVDAPVTRLLLDVELPAAAARTGAVALEDGSLLVPLEGEPWLVEIDRAGQAHAVGDLPPFPFAGMAVGAAHIHVAAGPELVQLDRHTREVTGRCDRTMDPVVGPPVVGETGGTEIAVAAAVSGAYVAFRNAGGRCAAVQGPSLRGVFAAGRQAPGLEILAGGAGPDAAVTVLAAAEDGTLTPGRTAAGRGPRMPVASDGASVFFGEEALAVAFDLGEGGAGPVPVRSLELGSAITAPPIVALDRVIFPTTEGVAALPRRGPWTREAPLALGAVTATPAAAEGGTVWVASADRLHALVAGAAGLEESWSAPLEGGADHPLALSCDGELVLIAGARLRVVRTDAGPDPEAPWPQLAHDPGGTGNVSARYCSSR